MRPSPIFCCNNVLLVHQIKCISKCQLFILSRLFFEAVDAFTKKNVCVQTVSCKSRLRDDVDVDVDVDHDDDDDNNNNDN